LIEAAKGGFDLVIGGELAAFRLSKTFQDSRQMRRIDGLRHSLVTGQGKHGLRDFVLAARRQPTHRFEGFLEEPGHGQSYATCGLKWKGVGSGKPPRWRIAPEPVIGPCFARTRWPRLEGWMAASSWFVTRGVAALLTMRKVYSAPPS
jgi:hypothetical protein